MLNADSPSDQVPVTLIEQLVSVAPVYYALGNHEIAYMDRGHGELITNLEEAGAVVLEQSYADLEINGVDLRLGGMYEYAFGLNGNNDAAAAPDDVEAFLTEFQDTHRTKVMMAHRPIVLSLAMPPRCGTLIWWSAPISMEARWSCPFWGAYTGEIRDGSPSTCMACIPAAICSYLSPAGWEPAGKPCRDGIIVRRLLFWSCHRQLALAFVRNYDIIHL